MGRWNVPSRFATTALVGLAVLDVVLVGTALRSTHVSGGDTSTVSSAQASADSRPARATPSSTPADTEPRTAGPKPLRTMLVAVDDQRAWRAGAGSCSAGGATLAITTDGGRAWAKAEAPLRRIVRVRAVDSQAALVIGADSSCAAELRNTSDGGDTWGSVESVADAWFRDPGDSGTVGAPGRSTSQPCGGDAVLDLAVISAGSARVLCVDGLVRSSADAGSSWSDWGRVAGAVALAVPSADQAQTFVAVPDAPGCVGVQVWQVGTPVATSCVEWATPKDPGRIALSLVEGGGWLAVGDVTLRSTDGLVSWTVS